MNGLRQEEKVRIFPVGQIRETSGINGMGTQDNPAGLSLTEDTRQSDNRNTTAGDDVEKHVAGPDTGQLFRISNQDHPHRQWNGFQQLVHQKQVDHGAFIDQKHISLQRILGIELRIVSAAET